MNLDTLPKHMIMIRSAIQILIFLSASNFASSQEFSFILEFQDAAGNSDTIEIGYDTAGTESIDSIFNEVNIIETAWDSVFEVRITSELRPSDAPEIVDFHTKKQIIDKECTWHPHIIIEVNIKAIHWPVTASWDPSIFTDTCNEGSVITSINPGGWWDTGSPSDLGRVEFKNTSSIEFSPQHEELGINPNYAFYDLENQPISVYWVGLGEKDLAVSGDEYGQLNKVAITPNPTSDELRIEIPSNLIIKHILVIDLSGRIHKTSVDQQLDLSSLPIGIYLVSVETTNGLLLSQKVLKK